MTVRVLFFGPLTTVTGSSALEIALPDSSTVHVLLEELFRRWPALHNYDANLLVAVNLAYARRDELIPRDAEVAIMPPVQGG